MRGWMNDAKVRVRPKLEFARHHYVFHCFCDQSVCKKAWHSRKRVST